MLARLAILFCLAVLFSACHTGGSLFLKRKYTKGHFFDLEKHARAAEKRELISVIKQGKEKEPVVPEAKEELSPTPSIVVLKERGASLPQLRRIFNPSEYEKSYGSVIHVEKNSHLKNLKQFSPLAKESNRSVKEKLISKIEQKRASVELDGATLAIGLIGFVLLTLVYFISILSSTPGINPLAALVVAMILAALSVLTGAYFF